MQSHRHLVMRTTKIRHRRRWRKSTQQTLSAVVCIFLVLQRFTNDMNTTEHLLTCLAEECAEVAKECGKALRFGTDDKITMDPKGPRGTEGPTNAEKIAAELCDLFAVAQMLTDKGVLPGPWYSAEKANAKKRKVESYMDYARRVGALENSDYQTKV